MGKRIPGGCSVESCADSRFAKDLCVYHYRQRQRRRLTNYQGGLKLAPGTSTADKLSARSERQTNGCVLWTGSRNGGYGELWAALPGQSNRKVKAHRAAWTVANGQIPPGMQVLHRCDTPPCINPEHLFLGTQADNVRDMDAKGRRGRWKHKYAALTCVEASP
jgi:hypothetical protein